jgi:hypothetical protein
MATKTMQIRINKHDFDMLKAIFSHHLKDIPEHLRKNIAISTPSMLNYLIEDAMSRLKPK